MESTNHSSNSSKVGGGCVSGSNTIGSGGGVNNSGVTISTNFGHTVSSSPSSTSSGITQTTPKKSMLLNFRPSSFVSSRAQALRQKFANSKRSLSDSCREITSTMSTSFGSETPTNPNNMSVESPPQPLQPPQSRFQQRRGAVVPVPVLPEYDPDPYSPLGSPSHDELCIDADLLGLSSPAPAPPIVPLSNETVRQAIIEKLEDIARPSMIEKFEDISKQRNENLLWQRDDATLNHKRIFSSSPSMADNKFSLAEALISDDRRRPRPPGRLPLTSSGSTGQLSLKLNTSNWPGTLPTHYSTNFDNEQPEITQKEQSYDDVIMKSVERSTSPKDPWSTSDDEVPITQYIPTLSCTPPAILQQLPIHSPSPSVHSSHPAAGSSNKHGGCCMPIPSHPTPTPSPPSPPPFPGSFITSPQSGKSRKSYTGSARSGSSSSGHHHHVHHGHHGHHGSYSRSESVASISVGSGGCLSGLYNPLDWKSRSGNPKLIHQMSMDETRSCSVGRAATPAATAAAAAAAPAVANAVAANAKLGSPSSSPDFAYRALKSSTASTTSSAAAAAQLAVERRKKRLLRKQTNSAPDSLEENTQFTERLCVTYYLDNEYNKGRNIFARRSWQGEEGQDMLLKVPVELGLRGRGDGNRDESGPPYMNLPSPNVQNEENESDVFRKLSAFEDRGAESDHEDIDAHGPPASALTRRRALVPPKLLSDAYESANEDADSNEKPTSKTGSTESLASRKRRSSIVVIPPMQICPGDLLVYSSKVLTQRNNLLGDLDGSTQSLAVSDEATRKGKNTWSLLRLFDRSSRTKSESLFGLEEVLTTIPPSDFADEQLSKYKGMPWIDFLATIEERVTSPEGNTISTTNSAMANNDFSTLNFGIGTSGSNNFLSSRSTNRSTSPIRSVTNSPEPPASTSSPSRHEQAIQTMSRSDLKRQEAVWDLFQSECLFLYDHLMVLKNVFMEPLKKVQVEGYAMFAEPEVLFGNLDELCCVTYAFCKEFINLILQNISGGELQTMEVLIRLFQKSSKAMSLSQAYHRYALNYINALNYLETLRRQIEFNEFEKFFSRDTRCKKLQLTDLLVAPVQHIMKIPIILKDIESRTEDANEKAIITEILASEENSLRELDDKMKWLKNFERLLEIQRNIIWPSVVDMDPKTIIPEGLRLTLSKQPCERLIVSPRRQIIKEGGLQLFESGKPTEMFVILFDDMLLITRKKKGLHKKKSSISENWSSSCGRGNPLCDGSATRYIVYRQPLSLDRFYIHDVSLQDAAICKLENAFVLVIANRFQQLIGIYVFQSPTDQEKTIWLNKLRETQERWKRTLQNTVFRRIPGNPSGGDAVK